MFSALHSHLPSVFPKEAHFGVYSSDEVKEMSVVKIISPNSFNVLGHALPGGLYDPKLGPCDRTTACLTCGKQTLKCPGHIGHIELPLPVINPLFHKKIFEILHVSCLHCHHILLPIKTKALLVCQLRILNAGFLVEAVDFESIFLSMKDCTVESDVTELYLDFLKNDLDNYIKGLSSVDKNVNESTGYLKPFRNYDVEYKHFLKNAFSQFNKSKKCPFCQNQLPVITSVGNRIMMNHKIVPNSSESIFLKNASVKTKSRQIYVSAAEVRTLLKNIWIHEKELVEEMIPVLKRIKSNQSTDMFFIDAVLVTPGTMRPYNIVDNAPVEHPSNVVYKGIINNCLLLRSIMVFANSESDKSVPAEIASIIDRVRGSTIEEKLQSTWHDLQASVDILLLGKTLNMSSLTGLKQIIEKKQGIIRMNMMGKRVNFAARSVITPDPNLDINEIGFPEPFAKILTYPVPVTPWNVVELRQLVKNGPNIHPGAVAIISENGNMHRISNKNSVERESLANRLLTPEETAKGGKIVLRHLMNGDVLLVNRQPTLHKPSIMAHKVRILKGEKTLRLHYANCKAYNADFDGDEMNTHFAQNEVARSEAYNIVNVTKQYLVPKDGTPLSGLIQDHVIGGVHLSLRGKFFNKETFMHLVYQALSFKRDTIKIVPPCLIKPEQLWSGKQIISTIIINLTPPGKYPLNLESTSKIPVTAWGLKKFNNFVFRDTLTMTESEFIIRNGMLLSGVIDKNHCGATSFGLVHSFYELYGGEASSKLLSALSKLFTCFLQFEGFTLNVKDILVKPDADCDRSEIIKEVRSIGHKVAASALNLSPEIDSETISKELELSFRSDPKFFSVVDREYKRKLDVFTNSINSTCLPGGLLERFPKNNLQLMVQSGAKGSTVNTMQISCLLGQIELEGKRPPLMVSGRSLPSFKPFDTSPRAGGFIDGRFMTGIQPQEFFFHCMAGREGLIDTAVKTSRSGYLQRCLVKHLEGLVVNYDMTVRDGDGSVIQFLYGEDSLDVCKSQYFNLKLIPFLESNINSVIDKNAVKELKKECGESSVKSHLKDIKMWKRENSGKRSNKPFLKFVADMNLKFKSSTGTTINSKTGRSELNQLICEKWLHADKETKERYSDSAVFCPDPVISKYNPGSYFGSISEKLESIMEEYLCKSSTLESNKKSIKSIKDMISYKSMVSICPPGEPVGVLAAQSIGEPSTQMTLNTFHFAGRGEMNVTLGVPRLKEILTVASKNIKTPCVDIPLIPCGTHKKLNKRAEKLRKNMMKVTLSDVLEYVHVQESLDFEPHRHLTYNMHLQFLPRKAYKHLTNVKPDDILKHIEKEFLKALSIGIFKAWKVKSVLTHENVVQGKQTKGSNADEDAAEKDEESSKVVGKKKLDLDSDSSGESEVEDEDAVASKRRTQKKDVYDEPEDEETDLFGAEDDEDPIILGDEKEKEEEERLFNVQEQFQIVHNYKYDSKEGLWCKIELWLPLNCQLIDFSSLVKKIAYKSIIYEISNIKRAITYTDNDQLILKTDGINMNEIFSYCDILDVNKLYTNDIHCMAETYGIEAAARVIVKEIQNVFKVYGITVDPRHLLLVADYMTFDGVYSPLNRVGIEKNPSAFQQMSFECSLNFLKNATIQGKTESLHSPSSRLFVGKHCKLGTSMMDILLKC